MSILRRIVNTFSRSKLHREIDAEIQSHVEMRIADNIAAVRTRRQLWTPSGVTCATPPASCAGRRHSLSRRCSRSL